MSLSFPFQLGSVHKEDISSKTSHKEKYSLEKEDPVKSLKEFHKSFKVHLFKSICLTVAAIMSDHTVK